MRGGAVKARAQGAKRDQIRFLPSNHHQQYQGSIARGGFRFVSLFWGKVLRISLALGTSFTLCVSFFVLSLSPCLSLLLFLSAFTSHLTPLPSPV